MQNPLIKNGLGVGAITQDKKICQSLTFMEPHFAFLGLFKTFHQIKRIIRILKKQLNIQKIEWKPNCPVLGN